jgi:CRP-like cAMP-binding protein
MAEIHSYMEVLLHSEESPLAYPPGAVVFAEGEPGTAMYIVRTGFLDLHAGGRFLERLGPGGVLGEMALVDPAPRSATAVAAEGCSLVAIDRAVFDSLVRKVPGFALEVMRIMAARLRRSNARPAAAEVM